MTKVGKIVTATTGGTGVALSVAGGVYHFQNREIESEEEIRKQYFYREKDAGDNACNTKTKSWEGTNSEFIKWLNNHNGKFEPCPNNDVA